MAEAVLPASMPPPTLRAKRFPVPKLSTTPSPLLYADSERDANQLYFSGLSVPDPFLAFGVGRKKFGVFNALEFARAKKESALDVVLSLEEWRERAQKSFPESTVGTAEIVAALARHHGVGRFYVPDDFPAKLAFDLIDLGLAVGFAEGSFFPQRDIKKPAELEAIRIALVAEYLALVNSLVEGVAPQDAPGGSNLEEPVVETVAPTPPAAAKKKAPK